MQYSNGKQLTCYFYIHTEQNCMVTHSREFIWILATHSGICRRYLNYLTTFPSGTECTCLIALRWGGGVKFLKKNVT